MHICQVVAQFLCGRLIGGEIKEEDQIQIIKIFYTENNSKIALFATSILKENCAFRQRN